MTRKYIGVTIDGMQYCMSYRVFGDKPATLLCLHDFVGNSSDFLFLSVACSEHYRVICPDMFGRGASGVLNNISDYNYRVYCKSLLELLLFEKIEKLSIVGSSMGGVIGLMLATLKPRLVNGVVLNDIGIIINNSSLLVLAEQLNVDWYYDTFEMALNNMMSQLSVPKPVNTQWVRRIASGRIKNNGSVWTRAVDQRVCEKFFNDVRDGYEFDMSKLWHKIMPLPVLLLKGGDSSFISSAVVERMMNESCVDFIEYLGVSHPPCFASESIIQDVVEWLHARCG